MHFVVRRKAATEARQLGQLYPDLTPDLRRAVVWLTKSYQNFDWSHDEHALAPGFSRHEGSAVHDFRLVHRAVKLKKSFERQKKINNSNRLIAVVELVFCNV